MTYARKDGLALAILLLVTTLVYVNGLNNPFITDDRYIILKNFWQGWTLRDAFERSLFSTAPSETSYFRPLTFLTFAVNYSFSGNNPIGYRSVNLGIHLTVIVLVYLFIVRLASRWVAAFSALLYALHPAHVQAVSYISSRSDLLYTAFGFLGLLFWHKGNAPQVRGRPLYLGSALGCFFLGLFAKETIIVIPAIAVLMDLIWSHTNSWRKKIKENLPWYGGFLALFSIYLILRSSLGYPLLMEGFIEGATKFDLGLRALFALKLFGLYLGIAFYPAHLSLLRVVPLAQSFLEWQVILGTALLAAMLLLAWIFWRSRKEISFGILWYILSLLPVLNLTLLNAPLMEHWLYLPLVGLTLAFVGATRALAERVGEVKGAALGLIFFALLLSLRTFTRNFEWSNPLKMFSQDVSSYPGNFRAWSWLGDTLKFQGMWDGAIRAYKTSLAINPNQEMTWVALGEVLSIDGRYDEAEKILSWVVSMGPKDPWSRYVLGIHRLRSGKYREAIEAMGKSLDINPLPMTYHALGSAYLKLGEKEEAERMFQKALAVYPGNGRFHAGVHADLGKLYLSRGKFEEAKEEWQIALRFDPNYREALTLLEELPK